MLKNIGLSLLPVLVLVITIPLMLVCMAYLNPILGLVVGVVGVIFWVLLLPNAGYLITELNLNHRTVDKSEVPIWYDIIAVLSLAMSGVMNTLFNVMLLQLLYAVVVNPMDAFNLGLANYRTLWIIITVLFILISLGIYIGRYLRFNSWDVLRPKRFFNILASHFSEKDLLYEVKS